MLCFYAAVHAANYVIYGGANVTDRYDHQKRLLDIDQNTKLRPYSRKYRELMTLSETARYKPFLHPMLDSQVLHAKKLALAFLQVCGVSTAETPADDGGSVS